MRNRSYILILVVALITACRSGGSRLETMSEDKVAMELLQGVWLDDESNMPLLRISGNTITYVDEDATPVYFKIIRDSIYLLGQDTTTYKIVRQGESVFWLQTDADELIKLHLSDSEDDQYAFNQSSEPEETPIVQKQVQKDSVIIYNNVRYRGYVFINPSKYKVVKTILDENGIAQEVIFYDNIIHITVYEGANELYGKDISKQMFADYIDKQILAMSLLADMDFMGVDDDGYHYQAKLIVPDSSVTHFMSLIISPQGDLSISPKE